MKSDRVGSSSTSIKFVLTNKFKEKKDIKNKDEITTNTCSLPFLLVNLEIMKNKVKPKTNTAKVIFIKS